MQGFCLFEFKWFLVGDFRKWRYLRDQMDKIFIKAYYPQSTQVRKYPQKNKSKKVKKFKKGMALCYIWCIKSAESKKLWISAATVFML